MSKFVTDILTEDKSDEKYSSKKTMGETLITLNAVLDFF